MSSFPFTSGKLATAHVLDVDGQVGNVFDAPRLSRGTIQFKITGTVGGNVLVQASNVLDYSGANDWSTDDADWVTVDTTAVSSSGSLTILANFDSFASRFLRVYFDRTSGTGTADVWFCFKN